MVIWEESKDLNILMLINAQVITDCDIYVETYIHPLPVDLICSQAHILKSWMFLLYSGVQNSAISGGHQVKGFLAWRR